MPLSMEEPDEMNCKVGSKGTVTGITEPTISNFQIKYSPDNVYANTNCNRKKIKN